jgi:hypothetical protein
MNSNRMLIACAKATDKWALLNEFHPIPGFHYAINRLGIVKRIGFKT